VLVDAVLAAGLAVVVITSRQVKNLRSRFSATGAKDDEVLAGGRGGDECGGGGVVEGACDTRSHVVSELLEGGSAMPKT
jgi:hypothetical protein